MRPAWTRKLTAAEVKHIRQTTNRLSLDAVKKNVAFNLEQRNNGGFPCWGCLAIGRKLGLI